MRVFTTTFILLFCGVMFASGELGMVVGQSAPQLMLRDLNGKMVFLADFCGGRCPLAMRKNVVVHFFATHCKPCVIELPALRKLTETFPERELVILMVSVSEMEAAVTNYKDQNAVKAIFLLDKYGTNATRWGLTEKKDNSTTFNLPYNFLIDKDGILRAVFAGAHPNLDQLITAKLKVTPPAPTR